VPGHDLAETPLRIGELAARGEDSRQSGLELGEEVVHGQEAFDPVPLDLPVEHEDRRRPSHGILGAEPSVGREFR
jgi:hypothetical protein